MIVSNVRRMSKKSEADGGGTAVAASSSIGSADASLEVVPVAEEGGGVVPEGSSLGRLELGLNWTAFCLRKVAPMGATQQTSAEEDEVLKQLQKTRANISL